MQNAINEQYQSSFQHKKNKQFFPPPGPSLDLPLLKSLKHQFQAPTQRRTSLQLICGEPEDENDGVSGLIVHFKSKQ